MIKVKIMVNSQGMGELKGTYSPELVSIDNF